MKRFLHCVLGIALIASLNCVVTDAVAQNSVTYLPSVSICSNNLPYIYDGKSFYTTGTYDIHYVGVNNQDSVVKLSLTVYNASKKNISVTMCESDLKTTGYTLFGKTYKTPGIYTDTVASWKGCDSIITLTLNSHKEYNVSHELSLCQGDIYLIGGTVYGNTVGTFNKVENLKTVQCRCDSVVKTKITVLPKYATHEVLNICESSLPYNWHGINLYSNTYDTIKFFTVNGCDSVFTVEFNVKSSFYGSDKKVVCKDDLAAGYVYGKDTINKIGIYNVVFTAANGCDSTVTLTVNEGRLYFENRNITICSTELPYSFNGKNYTATALDTAFLTSMTGCDSIIALRLTVLPAKKTNMVVDICEKDLPYKLGQQEFTTSGGYNISMKAQNGCDSLINLTLIVHQAINRNVNVEICDNQLPYVFDNNNTFTMSGKYDVNYKTVMGCDSNIHITLKVNPTYKVMDELTLCHQNFPYRYGDSILTQGGYYTIGFKTNTGCDSIILLRVNEHFAPNSPDSIYGQEKIGKYETYTYYVNLVDNDFPFTYYEWELSNPNWKIVNHNREGNIVYMEIPKSDAYGESDITVRAINDCGESEIIRKHIRSYSGAGVRVYPNPVITGGILTVQLNDMIGENVIRISDIRGKILHQETVKITDTYAEITIPIENFAAGEYFLRVQTPEMAIMHKFVVLRENKK